MTQNQTLAVLDIGTNTILLLIAEVTEFQTANARISRVLCDEQTIVRLGEGLTESQKFSEAAMERALTCFQKYSEICKKFSVKKIMAFATSASRDAKNSAEFYNLVKKETGIDVQIITGKEEAKMSFLGGLIQGYDPLNSAILDIGGGSTEFVVAKKSGKTLSIEGESIDIGSVRAKEKFLKIDDNGCFDRQSLNVLEKELKLYWKTLSNELRTKLKEKEWIGVAGTVTTLAAIHLNLNTFDVSKIHGLKINRCDLVDLYEGLALLSPEQLAKKNIIGKGRADVITAGALILNSALEEFDKNEITVSIQGLRYGALLNY